MEALSEYLDFKKPNSLVAKMQPNQDGQFPLKLIRKELITHDTYIFEFEYPDKEWISGLWPAGHYHFHAEING